MDLKNYKIYILTMPHCDGISGSRIWCDSSGKNDSLID